MYAYDRSRISKTLQSESKSGCSKYWSGTRITPKTLLRPCIFSPKPSANAWQRDPSIVAVAHEISALAPQRKIEEGIPWPGLQTSNNNPRLGSSSANGPNHNHHHQCKHERKCHQDYTTIYDNKSHLLPSAQGDWQASMAVCYFLEVWEQDCISYCPFTNAKFTLQILSH